MSSIEILSHLPYGHFKGECKQNYMNKSPPPQSIICQHIITKPTVTCHERQFVRTHYIPNQTCESEKGISSENVTEEEQGPQGHAIAAEARPSE